MKKLSLTVAGIATAIAVWVGVSQIPNAPTPCVAPTTPVVAPANIPEGFVYGVDSSYDQLTEPEAAALRAAGVGVYVQAVSAYPGYLQQPAYRVVSLRAACNKGLAIAGYALIGDPHYTGAQSIDFARQGIPDDLWDALLFVAVDVETPGYPVEQLNSALIRLTELGKPMVVYTNCNTWVSYLGNPDHLDGVALWNAAWDNNPDFDFPNLQGQCAAYGYFQPGEVIGEQWSGGVSLAGQFVDQDIFRYQVPEPTPTVTPTATVTRTSTPTPVLPTPTATPHITPPNVGDGPCWGELDPRHGDQWNSCLGRWVFPGGWSYDPVTAYWWNPTGVAEWGECDPRWGGCWNLLVNRWVGPGSALYDPLTGTWSLTP